MGPLGISSEGAGLRTAVKELHVWSVCLDGPAVSAEAAWHCLSADERQRANRFRYDRDRRRFITCRGGLRQILGWYAQVDAASIRFQYGQQGKPRLAASHALLGLRFNLSHSDNLALFAVARQRDVGIDCEHIRAIPDLDSLADLSFGKLVQQTFRQIPAEEKTAAFFRLWTLQEALAKAQGQGLASRPSWVEQLLQAKGPAWLISSSCLHSSVAGWSVQHMVPGAGTIGAVAVRGRIGRLKACLRLGQITVSTYSLS
jgi:4'-phosphopantetheinyl transferase